jgi:lipoate-protein ligase A
MAIDEALLESTARREALPTLRLYAWQPACLSLGYAQPFSDADLAALQAYGWDLVRRPTGGRAILHVDELTYSVCGPQDEPRLAGSVLESYRTLSNALLLALQILGIPAEALPKATTGSDRAENSTQNPVCFETPSNYEITVAGKKLVGSAQSRRLGGVLQHGSLPLYGDICRITQALTFADESERQQAGERLAQRAATVEDILQRPVAWEQAAEAMVAAFQETLNLKLAPGGLTRGEQVRAEQLVREKYAHPSWNEKI